MSYSRIRHLRSLLVIHSFIYYRLCTSIVSDDTWQSWADELTRLQAGEVVQIGFYDDYFDDWTGDTGMHLPQDPWVLESAQYLLRLHEKFNHLTNKDPLE